MNVRTPGRCLTVFSTGSDDGDLCERVLAISALLTATVICLGGKITTGASWHDLLGLSCVTVLITAVGGMVLTERLCGLSILNRLTLREIRPGRAIPLPPTVTTAVDALAQSDSDISRALGVTAAEARSMQPEVDDLIDKLSREAELHAARTAGTAEAARSAMQATGSVQAVSLRFADARMQTLGILSMLDSIQEKFQRASRASVIVQQDPSCNTSAEQSDYVDGYNIGQALDTLRTYILANGQELEAGFAGVRNIQETMRHLLANQEAMFEHDVGYSMRLADLLQIATALFKKLQLIEANVKRVGTMELSRESSAAIVFGEFVRKPASARVIAEILRNVPTFRPKSLSPP